MSASNRQARRKQKKYGLFDGASSGTGIVIPDPLPSPEHYHLLFHSVKDDVTMPNWKQVFLKLVDAYQEMHRLGTACEPRTEWYEDGRVGIETSMRDRPGLWWLILEPASCVRRACNPLVRRERVRSDNPPKAMVFSPRR